MINQSYSPTQQQPNQFMVIFGLIILIGVVSYILFMAVDSLGLKEKKGTAVVISKAYREAQKTYTTQKVGDRILTLPQEITEKYILLLEIGDKQTGCAVEKSLYDALHSEDHVNVIYQKRRISGRLQVINVIH